MESKGTTFYKEAGKRSMELINKNFDDLKFLKYSNHEDDMGL